MKQLHKKFTDEQVIELFGKYLRKEVGRKYLQEILGINKTRFFALIKAYCDNPHKFSIQYVRKVKTRKIPKEIRKLPYLVDSSKIEFSAYCSMYSAGVRSESES